MGAWRRESRGRNLYGVFRCLVVLHTAQPFVTTLASRGWACLGGDSRCGVCIVSRDGPAVSRFGGGDCSACDAVDKKYASPRGSHGAGCGNRWRCRDRPRLVVRVEARVVERHPIANCWFGF